MPERAPRGAWVAAWMALTRAASPLAAPLLKRRLARGKELPDRWREKLGEPGLPRPEGEVIWLHAVGLGEVLALRGLIAAMAARDDGLNFLVTSTSRSSAEALSRNLPPRTRHQFLPLDLAGPRRRFLDHWRPDLSVWAEQDLWPGLVTETARRGMPLALVNARMNRAAYARRARARGLFGALYRAFGLIAAQDEGTARHLEALGAPAPVMVTGSLKPGAPALSHDPAEAARLSALIGDRPVWLAASTHPEDEEVALAAHRVRLAGASEALLILAPRLPARGPDIAQAARSLGLAAALRSAGAVPEAATQVYIADTIGEMGLWYRLASAALIGGGFGAVEGHNPWEAALLGPAILHGPRTANFAADYAALDAAGGARSVDDAAALATALADPGIAAMPPLARALADAARAQTDELAGRLLAMAHPRPSSSGGKYPRG